MIYFSKMISQNSDVNQTSDHMHCVQGIALYHFWCSLGDIQKCIQNVEMNFDKMRNNIYQLMMKI